MPRLPISIIGGGIGGLTLGRALLQHGIPTTIFERAASSPRNAYAITLHASAYEPLLAVLGMSEPAFRRRVAVDGTMGGSGRIDVAALAHPGNVQPTSFRVHRGKLEELLREGLDVRWEHAVEKVERTPHGSVLYMLKGQKIEQSVVIGADGPHSNTRKTLLPNVSLNILPFVAFNGKRRIREDAFQQYYVPHMKDTTVIELTRNGYVLHISIIEKTDDNVSISWIYSRPAQGPEDPLHKPNRPMSGATDIPDEFLEEVAALSDLPQPFKDVFDHKKFRKERVLHWLMRTVCIEENDLLRSWKENVIFIGDSAHAQPILGGEGANEAIIDGIQLAQALAKGGDEDVSSWYQSRSPHWRDGIKKSEEVIVEMHSDRR